MCAVLCTLHHSTYYTYYTREKRCISLLFRVVGSQKAYCTSHYKPTTASKKSAAYSLFCGMVLCAVAR